MRVIQWIPTWQGLNVFQNSLGPCALDESSLSIGRVKLVLFSVSTWDRFYYTIHACRPLNPLILTSSSRKMLVGSEKYIPLIRNPTWHSMLVPRVCAPRVTRCSLGKYWSRDWFRGNFSLTQGLWNQQAANPGVHRLSMTHSGVRQRNLMMHAQCPLPVYYSQVGYMTLSTVILEMSMIFKNL